MILHECILIRISYNYINTAGNCVWTASHIFMLNFYFGRIITKLIYKLGQQICTTTFFGFSI